MAEQGKKGSRPTSGSDEQQKGRSPDRSNEQMNDLANKPVDEEQSEDVRGGLMPIRRGQDA